MPLANCSSRAKPKGLKDSCSCLFWVNSYFFLFHFDMEACFPGLLVWPFLRAQWRKPCFGKVWARCCIAKLKAALCRWVSSCHATSDQASHCSQTVQLFLNPSCGAGLRKPFCKACTKPFCRTSSADLSCPIWHAPLTAGGPFAGHAGKVSQVFFNFFSWMAASNNLFFASSTFTFAPCFSSFCKADRVSSSCFPFAVPCSFFTVLPFCSASALPPSLAALLPPQTKLLPLPAGHPCPWHCWLAQLPQGLPHPPPKPAALWQFSC